VRASCVTRKKLKLSSHCSESGGKKRKRGYGDAYGGVRWSLRLGVCRRVVGFVLEFGRNLVSATGKVFFTFNLFYKLCTFSLIGKYSAAINHIAFQHNKTNSRQI
jgi:hypothetical protein